MSKKSNHRMLSFAGRAYYVNLEEKEATVRTTPDEKGQVKVVVKTPPELSRIDQIKVLRRLEAFARAKKEFEVISADLELPDGWEDVILEGVPENPKLTEINMGYNNSSSSKKNKKKNR